MYEPEVNNQFESIETLPSKIRERFLEQRAAVQARTLLPWGEHCTECNWPTCYTTCELYSPRSDGACRQFVDGMVRMDNPGGLTPYLLKLRFKRWAKLWTVGNLDLCDLSTADEREKKHIAVGAFVRALPLPKSLNHRALRKVSYLRRRSAESASPSPRPPTCFLIECFNPNARPIVLTVIFRLRESDGERPFQRAVIVEPGYTAAKIPFTDISTVVDLKAPFEIEIVPNECDDTVLIFGLLDFVETATIAPAKSDAKVQKLKCIVWDLDNTLWDGILIEDGSEKLRLRQGVVDVIKETDQRGILHSIASKNDPDEAMKVLRMCGIDDYFLHPQISWNPKSKALSEIARLLNIGVDSLAFVDDQVFEREEVRAALPEVLTIDALEYASIPQRAECAVPITEESRARRSMYRQQQQRKESELSYTGDYFKFLRDCELKITINPLNDGNLERVYELAQRTNQMNFSDNRYPRERLKEIVATSHLETFVLKCSDRFGSYGIVGFAVVDKREPRLLDLMFSCRIQAKRVEHAFLTYLLNRFVMSAGTDFHANYRKTAKNAQSGKVFEQMGFQTAGDNDGTLSLVFPRGTIVPDDKIVAICDELGEQTHA